MSYSLRLFKADEQVGVYTLEDDEVSGIIEGSTEAVLDWLIDALEDGEGELKIEDTEDDEEDED